MWGFGFRILGGLGFRFYYLDFIIVCKHYFVSDCNQYAPKYPNAQVPFDDTFFLQCKGCSKFIEKSGKELNQLLDEIELNHRGQVYFRSDSFVSVGGSHLPQVSFLKALSPPVFSYFLSISLTLPPCPSTFLPLPVTHFSSWPCHCLILSCPWPLTPAPGLPFWSSPALPLSRFLALSLSLFRSPWLPPSPPFPLDVSFWRFQNGIQTFTSMQVRDDVFHVLECTKCHKLNQISGGQLNMLILDKVKYDFFSFLTYKNQHTIRKYFI